MEVLKVKISDVKTNPKNPRLIKDEKFKKLVKSIIEFPQMLELRPIVVDENNIVLGGNMRLKACKEVGLKEVFIVRANDLTEQQKDEFIVKDNVGFGEWDWDMLANESEKIIKEICPNIWEAQNEIFEKHVDKKWRFGNLWTSSISNYNISAPFHRDAGNIEGCVNVIIAKKQNATGGNTTVPDYGATVDSCDNSMLVYPAWRNVHGVTPIIPTHEGGYRNSLVFYPLKAFKGLK
jgi:hypothetical protein